MAAIGQGDQLRSLPLYATTFPTPAAHEFSQFEHRGSWIERYGTCSGVGRERRRQNGLDHRARPRSWRSWNARAVMSRRFCTRRVSRARSCSTTSCASPRPCTCTFGSWPPRCLETPTLASRCAAREARDLRRLDYAAHWSENLEGALCRVVRFHRLLSDASKVEIRPGATHVIFRRIAARVIRRRSRVRQRLRIDRAACTCVARAAAQIGPRFASPTRRPRILGPIVRCSG